MRRYSTNRFGTKRPLAAAALLAVACSGPAPDPRGLAFDDPTEFSAPALLRPATGGVYGLPARPSPSPAPMAEAAEVRVTRNLIAEVADVRVAVGRKARGAVRHSLIGAFEADNDALRCRRLDASDREAAHMLADGRADLSLIGGALADIDLRGGARAVQVGVELYALSVCAGSDVRSLSSLQIRQIFTGQVTDWRQLGFRAGAIKALVPADKRAREHAATLLIPGDKFAENCERVSSEATLVDIMQIERGAIGLLPLPRGGRERALQTVAVDWTAPSVDAFGHGTYPYGVPLQLVTYGPQDVHARRFLDFARSPEGRTHLGRNLTLTP